VREVARIGVLPVQGGIVERGAGLGFDDGEIWRPIEVCGNEQAVVPHRPLLAQTGGAVRVVGAPFDFGQDGVAHALEALRDHPRADRAGRVAAAQRQHAAAHPAGHRRRGQQIARQVENVAQVVLVAEAGPRGVDHPRHILRAQRQRAADAQPHAGKGVPAHGAHALDHIGLDEAARVLADV